MLSHPGRVRHGNEDACAVSPDGDVFVVCDGMGGAAAGEVASRLAVESLLVYLTPAPTSAVTGSVPAKSPQSRLNAAVQVANQSVFQKSRHDLKLAGMGTTLVALLYAPVAAAPASGPVVFDPSDTDSITIRPTPPTLWLANVGDSRCYLYRNRELTQLSEDHSLVEEQVRAGQITPDEAARSPMRNLITRAVGSQSSVEADIRGLRVRTGDLYLLASDGLNRELTDPDIAAILAEVPSPATEAYLTAACDALVVATNEHGGRDNVTVLLVAFPQGVEGREPHRP